MPAEKTIFTLGTSSRSLGEFVHLLRMSGVEMVVDVRSFPTSRFPHFRKEALSQSLGEAGLGYSYLGKELGGYRKRGYEAYMQTHDFLRGMELLGRMAARCRCAILCAERLPWRCHRRFIARSLEDRGWKTVHIMEESRVGEMGKRLDE
jgi:uncharacterized protein (DUF488 family)